MKLLRVIFVLFVLTFACACSNDKKEEQRTAIVARGAVRASIPSTGIVTPRNRLEIKPPVAGRIETILVKEGQTVTKGQVLARMSSNERAALLDAAAAKGQEEVSKWEDVYKATPVICPINGFIIQRPVESGQSVNVSDPILVMADKLIVKAQVDETDIGRIIKGQQVSIILDSYPEEKVPGAVEHIAYESKTINNVNIYEVDVLPSHVPSFFRAGMSASVNFMIKSRQDALLLPSEAIKTRGKNSYAFIKNKTDNELKSIQIQTGIESSGSVEVVSGLSEGDTVIIPDAKTAQQLMAPSGRRPGAVNPFSKQN